MKAKGGSAVSAVEPTIPEETFAADDAKPGKVAKAKAKEIETKTGKYGSVKAKAFKPSDTNEADSKTEKTAESDDASNEKTEEKNDWIEIELVGEDDNPIPGEKYEVTLPDGSLASGTLDGDGFARIEGFDPGECQISFPALDKEAWEKL